MQRRFQIFCLLLMLVVLSSSCQPMKFDRVIPPLSQTDSTLGNLPTVPSPTEIATANPDAGLTCWPIKQLEIGNGIRGGFLYTSFPYQIGGTLYANDIYYWDLNTFKNIPVKIAPHQLKFDEQDFRSSDGKLVAFISENNLVVIAQNDVHSFQLPQENLKIKTFLPNGQILLDLAYNLGDYYQKDKGLEEIYYLVDPITGETKKNTVFLPGFVPPGYDLRRTWTVQYSPNMKYILYRSSPEETDVQYTLFDIDRNQILWVGPDRPLNLSNFSVPAWEPDSKNLTTIYTDKTGNRSYFSISLDGKTTPMNNFYGAELYRSTSSPVWWNGDGAESPNWSPNGRYLASTGNITEDLFFWDSKEKKLFKPCLPNESSRTGSSQFIDWSFDGIHAYTTLTFFQSQTPVEVSPGFFAPDYITKGFIFDLDNKVIFEIPGLNDNKVFLQKPGSNINILGWVNWETP